MIVILGVVIVVAALIGVAADSLGGGVQHRDARASRRAAGASGAADAAVSGAAESS